MPRSLCALSRVCNEIFEYRVKFFMKIFCTEFPLFFYTVIFFLVYILFKIISNNVRNNDLK